MAFSAVELTGIIEERLANYYSDLTSMRLVEF
jgi:hypothetical protein